MGQIREYNDRLYEGQWDMDSNLPSGKGVQIWPDGSRYDGQWKEGKHHGFGRLVHAEGDVYEGMWKEDQAHGYGIYQHYNGNRYEEFIPKKVKDRLRIPHAKVSFDEYEMNIDLSQFNNINLDEENITTSFRMKKIDQFAQEYDKANGFWNATFLDLPISGETIESKITISKKCILLFQVIGILTILLIS